MDKKSINELMMKIRNQNKLKEEQIEFLHETLLDTTLGLKLFYKNIEEDYKGQDIYKYLNENYTWFEEQKKYTVKNKNQRNSNILINSDNYIALRALKDCDVKVDMIYIDPPYNTGNKDSSIRYNNDIISSEDPLKHSKWLSFMKKRLILSRELLKDNGIIFISIDDKEYAYLKVLMDEVYGEENFLTTIIINSLPNGRVIKNAFARQHEYVLCYTKEFTSNGRDELNIGVGNSDGKPPTNLQRGGNNSDANDRPKRFYPILVKNNKLSSIEESEWQKIHIKNTKSDQKFDEKFIEELNEKYTKLGYDVIWPHDSKNNRKVWQREFPRVKKEILTNEIFYDVSSKKIKSKPLEIVNPKTIMMDSKFAFSNGARRLNALIGKMIIDDKNGKEEPKFGYPKSVEFMKYLINLVQDDSITVLDFFAGSATTAEAVMELNKEDGGERRFIVITNNEDGICEEVSLPRVYSLLKKSSDDLIRKHGVKDINNELHHVYDENFKFLEVKGLDKFGGDFETLFNSEELYESEFNKKLEIELISKVNK